MTIRNYNGKKIMADTVETTIDALTVEEALQININGKPFTVTMRTPGNDESLIRGLLHSEDLITNKLFNPEIVLKKENKASIITIANITVPENELGNGYANSRSMLSVSSCGICGRTELAELNFKYTPNNANKRIDSDLIPSLFNKMNVLQHDFNKSGGTHAAAAFTIDGRLICVMEDIGRHNAVDKVIGELIVSKQLKEAKILTVSGRVSYEIIMKCFKAKLPFLAAVSAPSSLAVDYAKEFGITLFGFCRDGRATCYSHVNRLNVDKKSSITIE
ncbi:formate dehydrogenase accessory sulfurtransferase FdhD [Pontimicrobium sp. MEBiC06410]